jgi:DNA polymerase-1
MLHKALTDIKPDYVAAVFDTPTESFRKSIIQTYQATRKPTEENLSTQFNLVKEVIDAVGIPRFEKETYEADDVIGTLAKQAHEADAFLRIIILSGDKDMFQLVNDRTSVLTPHIGFSKSTLYDEKKVVEKLGVPPVKVADFKALCGDTSDNYTGLRAIGPKTAAKLLAQYGDVEHMDERFTSEEMTILKKMKEVATIVCDVPDVSLELDKVRYSGFRDEGVAAFQKFELYSLIPRFFPTYPKAAQKNEPSPAPVTQDELF